MRQRPGPLKKRILLGSLIVFLAVLLAICFSPLIVSNALRLWISWKARQAKLRVTIERIEAPFLRPVLMRGLRVTSAPDSAFRIDLAVSRASLELNLRSVLLGMDGRAVKNLDVAGVRAEVRRDHPGAAISEAGWNTFQRLLPNNFNFGTLDLRVEDGATVFLLRGASLSASEIQAGHFSAGEIMVVSPWLRQSFSDLRGATRWQGDRLTIAGLTLTHGLDIEWIAADLSHLGQQYLGLEFEAAVFGGKIRADISNDWHSHPPTWNVAGSAADMSLAQTMETIGFTDRANGLLHACKFTFRGDPSDVTRATASVWAELTGLKWRNRMADTIMLGATLYNQQIQLQQLYLKQSKNELTLSGEGAFTGNQSGWLNPVFRGDISALIGNLGEFAGLFGANPADFAGEIAVEGTMNARDRKIGGHLAASGKYLSIFKAPIDSFATKLNLKATELEIERLELHHQNDFARATGKIDVAHEHEYSGTATFTAANLIDYVHLVPFSWSSAIRQGAVSGDWSGKGNTSSHSGKFHLNGRGILMSGPVEFLPFDAELDAAYSPANIFFHQLHLANQHASLNGFLTIAPKYLQLQAFALDLNNKPQLRGNVFMPIALSKMGRDRSILEALDPEQKLDFDLNIEPTNLAELARALTGRASMNGLFAGRFSIFGGLNALQGWGEVHLRDFLLENDAAPLSADAQTRLTSGTTNAKAGIQFRDSGPIALEASFPLRFGQASKDASSEPISLSIDFPKIRLTAVPKFLSRSVFRDGTVSGTLAFSETPQHPKIIGNIQFTKAKLTNTPLQATDASARLTFKGTNASIDSANLGTTDVDLPFRGEIDFADLNAISMTLLPSQPMGDLTPLELAGCISGIKISPISAVQLAIPRTNEIVLNGGLGTNWTVTLKEPQTAEPFAWLGQTNSNRTFPLCFGSGSAQNALVLGCESVQSQIRAEKVRTRKRARHP